jgi:hypothetical protein
MSLKPTCQVYSNIVFSIAYTPRALTCLTVTLNPGPDSPRCRSPLSKPIDISQISSTPHILCLIQLKWKAQREYIRYSSEETKIEEPATTTNKNITGFRKRKPLGKIFIKN